MVERVHRAVKRGHGRIRLGPEGFNEFVDRQAHMLNGLVLFNVRVNHDPIAQRLAAVRTGANRTVILVQELSGSTAICMEVEEGLNPFFLALEEWGSLSLELQASRSWSGQVDLALGALRSAGYLPMMPPS